MTHGRLGNRAALLLMVSIFIAVHQLNGLSLLEQCANQDTCERCLEANLACAWCTDKQFDMAVRCLTRASLIEFGCNEANIYENEPESQLLTSLPLKDYETVNDRAVQLTPQRAYLKLVKSHPQRIKLSYRVARNNPLDLYVLMDLTWTMRDDKETLVRLGANLTHTLSNLTPNYRLGFGSFADKPAMPMIMPQLRDNPCAAEHETCEPTYGYRHHMSLSTDVSDFIRSVNASRITGNLDNLEGGLDALMQVIVCPEEVGWKANARKVVILVTDGFMHVAGDGLLAGITQRNDKRCNLSDDGEYLGSLQYDYPSLEEIYRELVKRKVSIIFAVTGEVINHYHEMSGLMKEISNVELLSADSSNILELIKKSYESLIKRTQITDNSPDFVKVDYETDCGGHFSTLRKLSYCNNIELGKQVDFYVNLTLTDYPPDGVYNFKIRIDESSLNEYMEIDVELQKPCPCSEEPDPDDEYGRFQCSYNGYLQCGSCICDDGWTGTNCNCANNPTNTTTNDMLNNMCRPRLSFAPGKLGPICSNRGDCDCGSCICMPGYEGKYCECNACDDACDPERAECVCGQCQCKSGWSGKTCKCKDSTDGCIGPTGEICSKRGACQCDACVCDDPYLGNFCEIGVELDNKLCTFYEPCVRCLIEQKQGLGICENLTDICSSAEFDQRFSYAFVSEDVGIYSDVRCLVRITNKHGEKCDSFFTYESKGQSENYLRIQAVECEPLNYVAFTGIIAAITFILGLIIICALRAYFSFQDSREMARFEEDQRASIRTENPIYRDPIRSYQVPKQVSRNFDENPFVD